MLNPSGCREMALRRKSSNFPTLFNVKLFVFWDVGYLDSIHHEGAMTFWNNFTKEGPENHHVEKQNQYLQCNLKTHSLSEDQLSVV